MIVIDGTVVALAATGMKPESMPPDMGAQGAANVDCVTVWFLGLKTNWMVSPWDALTDDGLKARPLAPTSTWICAERTVVARAARVAEAIAKRIFGEFVFWCVGKQRFRQGRLIYDQRKILITWKGLYENCRRKKGIS